MNIEPYPIKTNCYRDAVIVMAEELIDQIDKEIDFYKQIGTPDQHRDVINALTGLRMSIVRYEVGIE